MGATADLLFDRFAATAAAVTKARPEVDAAMVREIFDDAATMLHNGLALDHLDDHDAQIVIPELCIALTDADPTTALMTRFYGATENPTALHDPIGVALAYENVLGILQRRGHARGAPFYGAPWTSPAGSPSGELVRQHGSIWWPVSQNRPPAWTSLHRAHTFTPIPGALAFPELDGVPDHPVGADSRPVSALLDGRPSMMESP